MTAKQFLRQLMKLDMMIENKREERERWLLMAVSTTAGAAPDTGVRVQTSGSKQRMADAVCRSLDILEETDRAIGRLYAMRHHIISVIEQLSATEYSLTYKMYVGRVETDKRTGRRSTVYMTLQEAAEDMGKSYSWARGVHGSALRHVQEIIDREQPDDGDVR